MKFELNRFSVAARGRVTGEDDGRAKSVKFELKRFS